MHPQVRRPPRRPGRGRRRPPPRPRSRSRAQDPSVSSASQARSGRPASSAMPAASAARCSARAREPGRPSPSATWASITAISAPEPSGYRQPAAADVGELGPGVVPRALSCTAARARTRRMAVAAAGSRPSANRHHPGGNLGRLGRAARPCSSTCASWHATAARRSSRLPAAAGRLPAGAARQMTKDPAANARRPAASRTSRSPQRLAAVGQQPADHQRLVVVIGRHAAGRQRLGGGQRKAASLRAGQPGQDNVAGQRMAERETGAIGNDQLQRRAPVQRLERRSLARDSRGLSRAAASRTGGRAAPRPPPPPAAGHPAGPAGRAPCPRTAAGSRPGHQWPADLRPATAGPSAFRTTAVSDSPGERCGPGARGSHLARLLVGEAADRAHLRAARLQQRPDVPTALARPDRAEQQHRYLARMVNEVPEYRKRRVIGPVEILQDHDHARASGGPAQHPQGRPRP